MIKKCSTVEEFKTTLEEYYKYHISRFDVSESEANSDIVTGVSFELTTAEQFKDGKVRSLFKSNISILDESLPLLGRYCDCDGDEGEFVGIEVTEEDFYYMLRNGATGKVVCCTCVGGIKDKFPNINYNGDKKKSPKWTEKLVQEYLTRGFLAYGTKKYEYCNMYTYKWESDYLCITKSDVAYECEVKISRGDFFNDSKKQQKHLIVEGTLSDVYERPNYFYYAVPENLIKEEEVPEYAGLIYVSEIFPYVRIVKQAPKLHGEKFNYDRANLTDKFYYNYLNYKAKYEENSISELKATIKRLEKDIQEYGQLPTS